MVNTQARVIQYVYERSGLGNKPTATLSTCADDTQIFSSETQTDKLQEIIKTDVAVIDRWYDANGMRRNQSKYQVMVMGNL